MSAAFEVRGFRAEPGPAGVAVLELEGRLSRAGARGRARLLVERGAVRAEVDPVEPAASDPGDGDWHATFAVPLAAVDGATFALAVGRDLLDLPTPDLGRREDDAARLARLAREANELRRRLDEAREREGVAEDRARRAGEARRRTEADVDGLRAELAAVRAEAEAAREDARAAREEADRLLEEAQRAHADERAALEHRLEQAERALARAGDEADRRVADALAAHVAGRERLERELSEAEDAAVAAREEADAEADRRVAEALAQAARERDDAVAAQRARAAVARRELQVARADLEALRRQVARPATAAARFARPLPPDEEAGTDAGPAVAARGLPPERAPAPAAPSERRPGGEPTAPARRAAFAAPLDDPEETVRVLSRAPRPRHRPEDETEPHDLDPDAIQMGARSITAGSEPPRGRSADPQRIAALVALAIAVLAFVLVVLLRVGPL